MRPESQNGGTAGHRKDVVWMVLSNGIVGLESLFESAHGLKDLGAAGHRDDVFTESRRLIVGLESLVQAV